MKKDDGRRDSAASEAPVEGASLAAVSSLMDERRRFEGWIASLEARRGATAPHVFERVHADYTTRLLAVLEKLTTHADGLRSELAALSLRLDGLRDEQKRAEDERSEGELRAHVGELSASDWERMASSSDARLTELGQKYGAVEQELVRTRELLDAAERPAGAQSSEAAAVDAPPAEPVAAQQPPSPAAEAPPVRKSAPVAARQVTASVPEVDVERKPSGRASGTVPQLADAPPAEQQSLGIGEPAAPAAQVPAPAPAPPAPQAPPAAFSASPAVRPGVELTPPSSPRLSKFDELAFLSSVVDTPSGEIEPAPADLPDEKTRRETFAMRAHEDEIENLSSRRSTPLDNLVTEYEREETSALARREGTAARTSTGADGAKTLKCSECASMNYPTEWYCERCGAELASL